MTAAPVGAEPGDPRPSAACMTWVEDTTQTVDPACTDIIRANYVQLVRVILAERQRADGLDAQVSALTAQVAKVTDQLGAATADGRRRTTYWHMRALAKGLQVRLLREQVRELGGVPVR